MKVRRMQGRRVRQIRPGNSTAAAKSLQSCPTLCDPADGSPPGSSDPGILQARTLEWVAILSPEIAQLGENLIACVP